MGLVWVFRAQNWACRIRIEIIILPSKLNSNWRIPLSKTIGSKPISKGTVVL
ncbi:hypothetical protein ES332_A03G025000v1 [Gossypium tomentosum]|uniref:Uncharacterized protein n=1 Tax=Gossypium tomentosum TaxID=34277 RepID=A0A5D2R1W3_GOSTO|nr:hypothetical protein ES332_A03G025000v1 [Gossypium tomentosum]TYI34670.1 hypothetical protein ES332_A03G025000v1 [Gossypium tomentosum]